MTFGQAKEELAYSVNAYADRDLAKSINRALRALIALHPLKCLRKVYRFCSAGPEFVLPQGCAGLVRACVNGRPVTMRGQDFRFLQAGPGDMDRPGFRPVSNVADLGVKPVMFEPRRPFRVYALEDCGPWNDGDPVTLPVNQQPPVVTVRGLSVDGTEVKQNLVVYSHDALVTGTKLKLNPEDGDDGVIYPTYDKRSEDERTQLFATVTSVTIRKPDPVEGKTYIPRYVNLCFHDDWDPRITGTLATCNPHEVNPKFRHYELVGYPPNVPCDILAEVRMGHIDLVDDEEELPFDTVEPIGWMIRANWEDAAGEVTRADQFRAKAEAWLKRMDDTDKTVQTRLTINAPFAGSQGEISMRSMNV